MLNLNKIKKEKPITELINFGILNIDKPSDWTSFDVVNYMRKILSLKKCGHFGTLDPQVTGVLPIALGNCCKIQENFMHHDKIYIGKMQIHKDITEETLKKEMKKFIGVIDQLPPRISRVKRVLRKRKVTNFELVSFDKEKKVAEFVSHVEAGTYIRKLIDDLGKNIGGAHMIELRRTKAGLFSDKDKEFSTIKEIEKAVEEYKAGNEKLLRSIIIPAEVITELLPQVEVDGEFFQQLKNGSPIFKKMLINEKEAIKIINSKEPFAVICDNQLAEIAKFSDHFENKDILAKPEAVLI
jgi:H/ACA ribonucleoprotein complex subunit 4